jgi:cytochrome c peroxidase
VNEMRTTTLLALGLGAAAITMMDPKRRKRMMQMMEPMTNNIEMAEMMPSKRTIKKFQKRMMKTLS